MPQSEFWPFTRVKQEDNNSGGKSLLLQKQLGDMEGEVKEIEMELAAIRRNRHDVRLSALGTVVQETHEVGKEPISFESYPRYKDESLHKDDNETSKLREDLIRANNTAEEERLQRKIYETRLQDLELKLNDICAAGRASVVKVCQESRKTTEDEVVGLKAQVRDLKDQIEEMKISDDEKSEQLQEYRTKYLQAQQNVEELQRQIDVMEFDNKQASGQIQMELHKMKIQFQEKLQELAPLPDLLKGAQIQLQEAKQLQKLAEDNTQQVSNELHKVKEKLLVAVNSLNQEKIEKSKVIEDNNLFRAELDEKQTELERLLKSTDDYNFNAVSASKRDIQLHIQRRNMKESEFAFGGAQNVTGGGPPPPIPPAEDKELIVPIPDEFAVDSKPYDGDNINITKQKHDDAETDE